MDRNQTYYEYQILRVDVVSLESIGDNSLVDSTDLEAEVDGRLTCDQILMLLTPRQQEVVLLKLVGYRKHREIAAIMGLSLSTIEKENRKIKARIDNFLRKSV
jgi:DNA-directed RNA polymerase specialized sigma24 family protein